jgi:hypothetical protein
MALVAATSAQAWGTKGHEWISGLAVERLPAELPAFVRSPAAAAEIAVLSREPDRWRGSGLAHDAERDTGHYIHADDSGLVMGAMPFSALPRTRELFDTALRAKGSSQYQAGHLPYEIIDGWQQLVRDFAMWRAERVAARNAKDPSDRAWFVEDVKRRERLTVRDLGVWSHYVGDASNPMHASTHIAVWGANPPGKTYSNDGTLHWRFEGTFVKASLTRAEVVPGLRPYRDCACGIEARTGAYLEASRQLIVPLYDLDAAGAFGKAVSPESRAFVLARLAAGSNELRDMIVDAWRASDAVTIAPGVKVTDVESGKAILTRAMFGDE